jgi:hypothetical protein
MPIYFYFLTRGAQNDLHVTATQLTSARRRNSKTFKDSGCIIQFISLANGCISSHSSSLVLIIVAQTLVFKHSHQKKTVKEPYHITYYWTCLSLSTLKRLTD